MDHVEFPQYVEIMLVKELTLVGFHMDEDGDRRVSTVRRVNTLVESLER